MGNTIPISEYMKLLKEGKAWWEEAYKECPTNYPSFVEDRPLILWLRGQLK